MKTYDLTVEVISKYFDNKDTIEKVIEKIRAAGDGARIAFYPCSKYANMIVKKIKQNDPQLLSRIDAFLDKSDSAKSDTGVNVYRLDKIAELKKTVSLVVVAHNTYYDSGLKELRCAGYNGKVIKTSYFDISLPDKSRDELLADVKKVFELLEDEKSKAVYLATWLSRALNDDRLLYLFEGEKNIKIDGQITQYKSYKIKDLGDECARELYAEIYKMRYVYPEPGEVVLDIGAYKGDSAIFFADGVGQSGKVFAFEPTSRNFATLVENINLNNFSSVIVPVNKGLSDKAGTLKALTFDWGAPSSYVSDKDGNEEVQITTIDRFIDEEKLRKLDFIKMDVEGLEEKVISGGEKTIKEYMPKMAVPLYHNTSDLTILPLLVNKIGDYKFYIRSKIEGPFGVMMYCLKK